MAFGSEINFTLTADEVASDAFAHPSKLSRILIYAPLAYSTPHFETDLEIAQRHLDLGHEVELILCDAELTSCQLNPQHEPKRCVQCVSRNLQGCAQLSSKVAVLSLINVLSNDDRAILSKLPSKFADQAALRAFEIDGFDAGLATLSSLIDFARSPVVNTQELASLVHRTLTASVASFLGCRRILSVKHYDRVYIYNGRWSMMRSAVRACEQLGVAYYTHERGSDFRKFALYRNTLPHDMRYFQKQAIVEWERVSGQPHIPACAHSFFTDRRKRVERNWFSYTKGQIEGRLPGDWDRNSRHLVLFTSSEFEFAAIGEGSVGKIFATQTEGLKAISARLAARDPGAHIWVRIHPNDDGPLTVSRWTLAIEGLWNVTLVMPDEKVDSYSMLERADRVLTFGSTMGIEATYWAKASICADFSFYNGLDAQYEAADEDDLLDLLCQCDLPPKQKENALRFGYYLNTFGINFLHFATEQISDYTFSSPFRGRALKPDYEELQRHMVLLLNEGELTRAISISRLAAQFNPADALAHSVLILSLIREGSVASAVTALESAAGLLNAAQLESLLRRTSGAIANRLVASPPNASELDLINLGRRAGKVLGLSPSFAGAGQRLISLAERSTQHIQSA